MNIRSGIDFEDIAGGDFPNCLIGTLILTIMSPLPTLHIGLLPAPI